MEYARSQKPEILPSIGKRLRRVRDRRYGRTYVAVYVCDGRELPDEDDEWAAQPEVRSRPFIHARARAHAHTRTRTHAHAREDALTPSLCFQVSLSPHLCLTTCVDNHVCRQPRV